MQRARRLHRVHGEDVVTATNIDLAPNHKHGLAVTNPILLGCGAIGYGEAVPKGLDTAELGAVVVGPILSASRSEPKTSMRSS